MTQADTIIPGGVQGLDRYAAMNNNPIKYIDPSGHDPITLYTNFIQGAIDFFQGKGYEIVGTAVDAMAKNIHTNGADLVFKAKDSATALAVKLKNVAGNVNLGTLGWSEKSQSYGGSIERVITSANRFVNSSNQQLAQESKAIIEAYKSGNLQNALYTTGENASANAAAQFNNVYTGIKENADKIIPPVVAAASKFVGNLGTYNLTPILMFDPRILKDPINPFYQPMD